MPIDLNEVVGYCTEEMRDATGSRRYLLDQRAELVLQDAAIGVLSGQLKAVQPVSHDAMSGKAARFAVSRIAAARPDLLAFSELHFNSFARDFVSSYVPLLEGLGVKVFAVEASSAQVDQVVNAKAPDELVEAVWRLDLGQDRTSQANLIRTLHNAGIKVVGVEPRGAGRRILGQEREDHLFFNINKLVRQHSPGAVACLYGRSHVLKEQGLARGQSELDFRQSFSSALEMSGRSVARIHIVGGLHPLRADDGDLSTGLSSAFFGFEDRRGYSVHLPEYVTRTDQNSMALAHRAWLQDSSVQTGDSDAVVYAVDAVKHGEPGAMTYLANLAGINGSPSFASIFYNAARMGGDRNVGIALTRSLECADDSVVATFEELNLLADLSEPSGSRRNVVRDDIDL